MKSLTSLTPNLEPDYDAEMKLPAGVTCNQCRHAKRCFAFGFSRNGQTSCDFHPNRFQALTESTNAGK